jgi:hypothetical protein
MQLFEVELKNRVMKKSFNRKRIRGRQGKWYTENLYYLAETEEEAKEFVNKIFDGCKTSLKESEKV